MKEKIKIGDPFEEDVNVGALISEDHLEKVLGYIDVGVKHGAKLLIGGNKVKVQVKSKRKKDEVTARKQEQEQEQGQEGRGDQEPPPHQQVEVGEILDIFSSSIINNHTIHLDKRQDLSHGYYMEPTVLLAPPLGKKARAAKQKDDKEKEKGEKEEKGEGENPIITDEIFGPAPSGVNYKENDRYNSTNPYSASKAGGEELVVAYENTYGLPSFITHTMNVFGERQNPEKYIPMVIKKVR